MRLKILMISPQIFINFFQNGVEELRIVEGALPVDAKYIRAFTDDITGHGRIGLVIESATFDELKDGDEIPRNLNPVFDKVYK